MPKLFKDVNTATTQKYKSSFPTTTLEILVWKLKMNTRNPQSSLFNSLHNYLFLSWVLFADDDLLALSNSLEGKKYPGKLTKILEKTDSNQL